MTTGLPSNSEMAAFEYVARIPVLEFLATLHDAYSEKSDRRINHSWFWCIPSILWPNEWIRDAEEAAIVDVTVLTHEAIVRSVSTIVNVPYCEMTVERSKALRDCGLLAKYGPMKAKLMRQARDEWKQLCKEIPAMDPSVREPMHTMAVKALGKKLFLYELAAREELHRHWVK